MRFSTVVLWAVTAIVFSATAARAEEPELANVPETTVVPVNSSVVRNEVLATDRDKASTAKMENSVIHIDDNNRLVGLSN